MGRASGRVPARPEPVDRAWADKNISAMDRAGLGQDEVWAGPGLDINLKETVSGRAGLDINCIGPGRAWTFAYRIGPGLGRVWTLILMGRVGLGMHNFHQK